MRRVKKPERLEEFRAEQLIVRARSAASGAVALVGPDSEVFVHANDAVSGTLAKVGAAAVNDGRGGCCDGQPLPPAYTTEPALTMHEARHHEDAVQREIAHLPEQPRGPRERPRRMPVDDVEREDGNDRHGERTVRSGRRSEDLASRLPVTKNIAGMAATT